MDAIERALQTLGLGPDATPQDIKQAYRDLVVVWHPDRFPKDSRLQRKAEENLKEINKAYEILRGYDPASRVRSGPHTTLWAWPNPAQDRPGAGAPRQSSSAPTSRSLHPLWAHIIGTMSRSLHPLWAYIAGMMSRSPVPLWAYITGTIIAICLVGYVIEAPKTSRRPIQSTPGNGPSIGSPEELSPPSKPTGPPIGLPPDDANRGEYSSREGASDRGASSSLAGGGPQHSAPSDVIPAPGAVSPELSGRVSPDTFTVGSTKDEVLAVQGTPTEFSNRVWKYGSSSVLFSGGRVASWDVEPDSPLKVRMVPSRPGRTTKGYFTVGSTKDEVLAVQGTPTEFTDSVWKYGSSSVLFSGGVVTRCYSEPDSPLKVRPK